MAYTWVTGVASWAGSGATLPVDLNAGPYFLCSCPPSFPHPNCSRKSIEEESLRAQDWKFSGEALYVKNYWEGIK